MSETHDDCCHAREVRRLLASIVRLGPGEIARITTDAIRLRTEGPAFLHERRALLRNIGNVDRFTLDQLRRIAAIVKEGSQP